MPMFEGFDDRLRGTVALALQEEVAKDIDRLIWLLLGASIVLWSQDNWFSYNDDEENCTVQLYRWCHVARRHDVRFSPLIPHLEWVNVTAAMLAGAESVKGASRPDLRIEVGLVGRAIECKRLAPTARWTRAYVYKGLARFVVGNYGHDEAVGYMVGYVQAGINAGVLARINQQVAGHPKMGGAHELKLLQDDGNSSWSRSCHARASGHPIQVDHLLVEIAK
jgi:hypothetical protein